MLKKNRKKNCFVIFFGVEGCVVVHPRITIIKEEEEEISRYGPTWRIWTQVCIIEGHSYLLIPSFLLRKESPPPPSTGPNLATPHP